jgi:hypothetical protein
MTEDDTFRALVRVTRLEVRNLIDETWAKYADAGYTERWENIEKAMNEVGWTREEFYHGTKFG